MKYFLAMMILTCAAVNTYAAYAFDSALSATAAVWCFGCFIIILSEDSK